MPHVGYCKYVMNNACYHMEMIVKLGDYVSPADFYFPGSTVLMA